MRLSAAVVLSFLLLFLVPDASCGLCANADEAHKYKEASCSTMIVLVYLNGWEHRESRYIGGVDCSDQRLFISTTSFIRAEPNGRIMEQHITPNYNSECKPTCHGGGCGRTNGVYSVSSVPEYQIPFDEAFKEFEKMTDIMLYVGSKHANNYPELDFPYDKRNLELKDGTKLENVNEKGRFFVSGIVYYAPKDSPKDRIYKMGERVRRQFYPPTKPFTEKDFYDHFNLAPSQRWLCLLDRITRNLSNQHQNWHNQPNQVASSVWPLGELLRYHWLLISLNETTCEQAKIQNIRGDSKANYDIGRWKNIEIVMGWGLWLFPVRTTTSDALHHPINYVMPEPNALQYFVGAAELEPPERTSPATTPLP